MLSLPPLSTLCLYLSVLALTWIFYYTFYVFLFHPLRNFPGPALAKLTDAYGAWFAYQKTLHTKTYENFKIYGDVFRHAPNRLVFNSAAAVQNIFLNPRVAKGDAYNHSSFTSTHRYIANTTDRDDHRRKRRIVGSILTERSMRIFEPTMSGRVNEFLQKLKDTSDSATVVNMSNLCMYLATDITGDLAFGYKLNTQTEETNRFIPLALRGWGWRTNLMMQLYSLRIPNLIAMAFRPEESHHFKKAVKKMVSARMAMDKDAVHDFYSVAFGEIGIDGGLLTSEMWPEAVAFLLAGGSTSAATMSGTFFYLSRYMDCYVQLAKEIRTTFTSASEINAGPKLAGCKYLRACIEETLRCAPPVATILWRQQDPLDQTEKPFMIDGHVVPRGTQVGVNLYSLFHNEEIFADPFLYNPQRWLDQNEDGTPETLEQKDARTARRKAFIPFTIGDRSCAGQSMAWMEMSLTIARAMWYFDFEAVPGKLGALGEELYEREDGSGSVPTFATKDVFTALHDGPNLVFRKRKEFVNELDVN